MLGVNRGTFLSLICRQIDFQDDFSINRYPNFDLKISNFSDSKMLGNVIIFAAGRITVENQLNLVREWLSIYQFKRFM